MRAAIAIVRSSWQSARSYRLRLLLSLASLALTVVPLFFVARALQPFMASRISGEGGQYFGFLVVGNIAFWFTVAAVTALPDSVGTGIVTGTFEAQLGTPTSIPALLFGLAGYNLIWTGLRAAVLLLSGYAFGAHIAWGHLPLAVLLLALVVAAHAPIGLMATSLVLAFRTTGPLPQAVLAISALLGGVYYPTHVIPSWIQDVSRVVPLTYGLRAIRRTLLDGAPWRTILPDVAALCGLGAVLAVISVASFSLALRHARRAGTLAYY